MTWKPLLEGAQRDAALATVRDIGLALNHPPPCSLLGDQSEQAARITNATLGMGNAGTAVGLGYLSLVQPDDPLYAATARRLIADAAGVLSRQVMRATLYSGFVGIAWALARLRAWKVVEVGEQSFAAVDKGLVTYVDRDDWPNPVELIYGVAGFLVYALARLPNPDARRIIELGLRALEVSAELTPEGLTWFVPAAHLRSATLERAPEGCYNLGVSHGNPGVISVLAEIHRLGIDTARTQRLLEGSVRWVLAQELPGGRFPSLTGPGVYPKPARVSWCYGSPGIPITLLRAARALGRDDWHATALRLATVAAETPFEASGVIDPPFCHGAVGLMHQFNRLYQETGLLLFADAARTWFDHTLAYRIDGEGVAGFSSRSMPGQEKYA
ncbi:MAG TPA: lanthionine synthetase C family protein, partial [Thermoanaerobaculia bacterium]|nr:lanthionine synthetase C family protein [Thermoanaerobaculia bacterium]